MEHEDGMARVRRYYELVDEGKLDEVLALFDPDIVYDRPGYDQLRGYAAVERFYREVRVVADGRHTLDTVVADGHRIAVHGSFEGILRDGEAVRLRFADFFELAPNALIARRDTFFFQPMV